MNPKFLKTFLAVTRHRNLTRAAAEIHLSQSSVSDQIQTLEAEMGASLFIRAKSGLELTPAGEALKPYAEEMLAIEDEARAAVAATMQDEGGSLTIGALETIASSRLAPWLSRFRTNHPQIDLRLRIGSSGELIDKLERREIDIAFCFHEGDVDERLVKRTVAKEPISLIGSPDRASVDDPVDLTILSTADFVVTEPGCVYRRMFDAAFTEAGFRPPKPAAEVGSINAITKLVAAGVGLALVPRMAICEDMQQGHVIELPWPGMAQTAALTIIWRRRRVQPSALRKLIAAVTDHSALIRSAGDLRPHAEPCLS